jgi:nicotinamide-nucleotide amidase
VAERGFATNSNQAKIELLGVPAELAGAVAEPVVRLMVEGALKR